MPSEKLVLVTGAAGFIGFHLSQKLCKLGYSVVGLDNLNDYYEIGLKHSRLELLKANANFTFKEIDLTDKKKLDELFDEYNFAYVINLPAQAGVRYSIEIP